MPTEREIEAAAKAMYRRHNAPCIVQVPWSEVSAKAQNGYREDARSAFEAAERERDACTASDALTERNHCVLDEHTAAEPVTIVVDAPLRD